MISKVIKDQSKLHISIYKQMKFFFSLNAINYSSSVDSSHLEEKENCDWCALVRHSFHSSILRNKNPVLLVKTAKNRNS